MDDIIAAISDAMPKFNRYLLKEYTKKEVNNSAQFIGTVFSEAVKQFDGAIRYVGCRVVSPEKRVEFEIMQKTANVGVRTVISELTLVEYEFVFSGRIYHTYLYMPYIKDDALIINNTRYTIQRTIVEKVFSKTPTGVTAKVIRAPIPFDHSIRYTVVSAVDGNTRSDYIVSTNIYNRKQANSKNIPKATILHYLLCKFGFLKTLERFGFSSDDIKFVPHIEGDVTDYDYFLARKVKSKKEDIYLKVKRSLLDNDTGFKFVANLLYVLTAFDYHSIEGLYEPTGSIWLVYMGRILHGDKPAEAQLRSLASTHVESLDTYLDPITQDRVRKSGIQANDIYDFFQYVFIAIVSIIINSKHSNLYDKRIDITNGMLVAIIGRRIFKKFYDSRRDQKKLADKDVRQILFFKPHMIYELYRADNASSDGSAFGDNWLITFGASKTRQSVGKGKHLSLNAPEHRFHPSIAVVETLISFSGQSPGVSGAINPFLQITSDGSIDVAAMPYRAEIDPLLDYLQHR